jgi:hypothetical protein
MITVGINIPNLCIRLNFSLLGNLTEKYQKEHAINIADIYVNFIHQIDISRLDSRRKSARVNDQRAIKEAKEAKDTFISFLLFLENIKKPSPKMRHVTIIRIMSLISIYYMIFILSLRKSPL